MLLLTEIYLCSKFCHALSKTTVLRLLARYVKNFSKLNVCSSEDYPSVRCASAAKIICRDVAVFGKKTVSLNLLYSSALSTAFKINVCTWIWHFFLTACVWVTALVELLLSKWYKMPCLVFWYVYFFISLLVLTLWLAFGLLSKHVNK
jgi:hypothetical protein